MDTLNKAIATYGPAIVNKVLMLQGLWFVQHGVFSQNYVEVYVSVGTAAIGATWSLWNTYGKDIVTSELDIWKAQALAMAAKMREHNVAPVTVGQIAAQSPTMDAAAVTKAIGTLPPAVQANIAGMTGSGVKVTLVVLATLFLAWPGNASAQIKLRAPAVTGNIAKDIQTDLGNSAPTASPTLGTGGLPTPDALIKKIIALAAPDLAYSAALAGAANTNSSAIRLACIKAVQALNTQASGANLKNADGSAMTMPAEPHIFTDLEIIAEGIDSLSPTGPLYTSCAGAAALAQQNVLTFINAIVTGTASAALVIPK